MSARMGGGETGGGGAGGQEDRGGCWKWGACWEEGWKVEQSGEERKLRVERKRDCKNYMEDGMKRGDLGGTGRGKGGKRDELSLVCATV